MDSPPGEQNDEDVGDTHHDHEETPADAGAEAVDLPQGDEGRREGEPRGIRAPEGQVEVFWPTLEDVKGVLWELAFALYDSPEEAFPSFVIEDQGLLESALALPHQPYYESFEDKLAAMVRSIASNHPLVDGNKRLALAVLHSTLLLNGRAWVWSDSVAERLMLRVAEGDNDFRWLARFIQQLAGSSDGRLARVMRERDFDSGSLAGAIQTMTAEGMIVLALSVIRGYPDELREAGPEAPEIVIAAYVGLEWTAAGHYADATVGIRIAIEEMLAGRTPDPDNPPL